MLTTTDKTWIEKNFVMKSEFKDFRDEVIEKLDNMISAIDHFMGKTNKIELEQVTLSGRVHQTIIPKVENHEKRILKLETKHNPASSVV